MRLRDLMGRPVVSAGYWQPPCSFNQNCPLLDLFQSRITPKVNYLISSLASKTAFSLKRSVSLLVPVVTGDLIGSWVPFDRIGSVRVFHIVRLAVTLLISSSNCCRVHS